MQNFCDLRCCNCFLLVLNFYESILIIMHKIVGSFDQRNFPSLELVRAEESVLRTKKKTVRTSGYFFSSPKSVFVFARAKNEVSCHLA